MLLLHVALTSSNFNNSSSSLSSSAKQVCSKYLRLLIRYCFGSKQSIKDVAEESIVSIRRLDAIAREGMVLVLFFEKVSKKKKIGVLCVRNFVIQTVCIHLHIEKSLLGCVKSFGLKKEVKITPTPRASRCRCTFNRLCQPKDNIYRIVHKKY